MNGRHILFVISCLITIMCQAQQMVPNNLPTPNASGLGMYGNIPVSYYTGRPNISIPIASLKEPGGMELPVYLQHDASGVMVNNLPSWTGHNWTLMAGGAITRSIEGLADEYVPAYPTTGYSFSNYFHAYNCLPKDLNNDEQLTNNIMHVRYDYAPDIFYFNFMGISGKFFLGNDGQWKVSSDKNLDIVFDINDTNNYIAPFIDRMPGDINSRKQPKSIKGFTIRDDKGYIYEFGGDNNSIEYSTNLFTQSETEQGEYWYATSWYLTKVKDKYGNVLFSLDYERGKFIAQMYYSASSIYVYENAKGLGLNYGQDYYSTNNLFPYGGTLNAPVYLKQICNEGKDQVVNFVSSDLPLATTDLYPSIDFFYPYKDYNLSHFMPYYYLQSDRTDIAPYQYNNSRNNKRDTPLGSTHLRQLDEIQLCVGETNIVQKIKLTYSYDSRMHLTQITESDRNNEEKHSYEFEYNGYNYLPNNYLTTASDHWGYYTGVEYKAGSSNIYELRRPMPTKTTYGLLTKVIYPTGGYSKLTYEQNDFSKCINNYNNVMFDTLSIAGGVRIKRIEDFSKKHELLRTKSFDYKDPNTGKSSGELFAAPCYVWDNWMANLKYGNAVALQSISRSTSIMPLANSFGPHIGYSYVTECNADSSCVRYHYINMAESKDERFIKDFCQGKPSPFDRFTDMGYKRGNILDIEKYDKYGYIKQKIHYSYPQADLDSNFVLTSNLKYVNNGSSATFSYFTGGVYKLLYPKYDMIGVKTTTYYENNDSVVDLQKFNKKNQSLDIAYQYPHQTIVRYLESEELIRKNTTVTKHYDYGFLEGTDVGKALCNYQFSLEPTQCKVYNNGILMGGDRITYQLISNYALPMYKYKLTHSTQELETHFMSFYPNYRLRTYQKCGEPITKLEWSYGYVSAKEVGVDVEGNSKPNSQRYEYDQYGWEGLTDILYPNGKAYHYFYDSFNRLTEVEDENYSPVTRYHYHYGK